jgi:hypothetical protein
MVIVKLTGAPSHPPTEGVTCIVAEIAAGFVLVVVKEMVPIPLVPKPMAAFVFVQLYTVPTMLPVKTMLPVLMPVQ